MVNVEVVPYLWVSDGVPDSSCSTWDAYHIDDVTNDDKASANRAMYNRWTDTAFLKRISASIKAGRCVIIYSKSKSSALATVAACLITVHGFSYEEAIEKTTCNLGSPAFFEEALTVLSFLDRLG